MSVRDYTYDYQHIQTLQTNKPWATDVKYFKRCRVSALAAMKMLEHALQGVQAGQEKGGKPLEIMGLLLGKPDGDAVVVLDTFPLPVEGTETKVMADDEKVSKYMIDLSEQLERTRAERLIGWYHSHPFDVGTESNCFLSATDVQTQIMWQRALDPKWIAIVVDPLRSLAKQNPEMMCFRVYPPDHQPPQHQCPDGQIVPDDNAKQQRWGALHHRYYVLKVEFFISVLGRKLLEILSKNHLWVRVLSSAVIMEPENRAQVTDRLSNLSTKLESVEMSGPMKFGKGRAAAGSSSSSKGEDPLDQATRAATDIAIEQCQGHAKQLVKNALFNDTR
jgi:COP9 signalosome complex subunit 5